MIGIFNELDSYAVYKAMAVIMTGFFAVLGFATETKNKANGRLTHWGWISIVGAVVAAGGGVITQIHDSSDDKIRRDAQDRSTKAILTQLDANLAKNTETLEEVQRASTVLQQITLGATFTLPLDNPLTKAYGEDLNTKVGQLNLAVIDDDIGRGEADTGLRAISWSSDGLILYAIQPNSIAFPTHFRDKNLARFLSELAVCLDATKETFDPKAFDSSDYPPFRGKEFNVCLSHSEFTQSVNSSDNIYQLPLLTLSLSIPSRTITEWTTSGQIISAKDLIGATLIIYSPWVQDEYWNILSLSELAISINRVPYLLTSGHGLETAVDKHGQNIYFVRMPAVAARNSLP
jgi:hypothetical protein